MYKDWIEWDYKILFCTTTIYKNDINRSIDIIYLLYYNNLPNWFFFNLCLTTTDKVSNIDIKKSTWQDDTKGYFRGKIKCALLKKPSFMFFFYVLLYKIDKRVNWKMITKRVRKQWSQNFQTKRAQPGSNRWPLDLQSNALPLSYGPLFSYMNLWACKKGKPLKVVLIHHLIQQNYSTF